MELKNILSRTLDSGVRALIWGVEIASEVLDRPPRFKTMTSALDGEYMMTEGPDDTWPAEPGPGQAEPEILRSEPQVLAGDQWGIRVPSGEIHWNMWQGTHLNNPMDRMQMIARINKTALDAGYAEGQLEEFLSRYEWVTRKQFATVVYEKGQSYSLLDPRASELELPEDLVPAGGTNGEVKS